MDTTADRLHPSAYGEYSSWIATSLLLSSSVESSNDAAAVADRVSHGFLRAVLDDVRSNGMRRGRGELCALSNRKFLSSFGECRVSLHIACHWGTALHSVLLSNRSLCAENACGLSRTHLPQGKPNKKIQCTRTKYL